MVTLFISRTHLKEIKFHMIPFNGFDYVGAEAADRVFTFYINTKC